MRLLPCILTLIVIGLPFSLRGNTGAARMLPQTGDLLCGEHKQGAKPLFLDKEISVEYRNLELNDVIHSLQASHDLPISYIDHQSDSKPISLTTRKSTVALLLQAILARSPGSICQILNGHVIIYPNRPEFKMIVRNIDIVNCPRGAAAKRYIESAKLQVAYFEDMDIILGGVLELPLLSDRVSLTSRASVIDHLVQILGRDESVFFNIRKPRGERSLFSLGSVWPGQ
jgi:hypothetical protein